MRGLAIRLKRHTDGSASLTLTRTDGSVTWQRQLGQTGNVFPPHDITHYAVETTLGYEHGFFGLVAGSFLLSGGAMLIADRFTRPRHVVDETRTDLLEPNPAAP